MVSEEAGEIEVAPIFKIYSGYKSPSRITSWNRLKIFELGSGSSFENRYRVGLVYHEYVSKPVGLLKILFKPLVNVKSLLN